MSIIEKSDHLRHLPIVVGKLKEFQKESLRMAGIDDHRIIEIPPGEEKRGTFYKFKKVFIPSGLPYEFRKAFLQEKFVKNIPYMKKGRRLYLSRKEEGDRRRIYNEEDVASTLKKFGFEIIFPERLSIKETVEMFSRAEIVVSSLGAQTANMTFTRRCPIILLVGDRLIDSRDFLWTAAFRYFFLLCDYVIPVVGKSVVADNKVVLDDLAVFRVEEVEQAVLKAESVLTEIR